jgi:flagellar hook protein FlgE
MLRSLNSGVSAMQQFQGQMDVIGNNVANVNTVGFKSARVDFADAFSQMLQGSASGGAAQIGTGVVTANIGNQFIQGAITSTGGQNDLAISGEGFFVVRDATTGVQYAARAGDFQLDQSGYLITSQGMRVQGYTDAGLTTLGDIQIDNTGAPGGSTAAVKSYSFDVYGKISVKLDDNTAEFTRGQVLLQKFSSPQSLVKEGNNLYSGLTAAGPLAAPTAPGSSGLGKIQARSLEMSNVDLAGQFSDLITTQRAFQASARIITTSDELLQELVNLKR